MTESLVTAQVVCSRTRKRRWALSTPVACSSLVDVSLGQVRGCTKVGLGSGDHRVWCKEQNAGQCSQQTVLLRDPPHASNLFVE